jgi:hypothetical protein
VRGAFCQSSGGIFIHTIRLQMQSIRVRHQTHAHQSAGSRVSGLFPATACRDPVIRLPCFLISFLLLPSLLGWITCCG